MRKVLAVVLTVVALAACGEPPVALDVPQREQDQSVLDLAGIIGDARSDLDDALDAVAYDLDVVALTFESPDASLGLADRAGKKVLHEWDADVVLVAVARPGDFSSTAADRRRFFGVVPADAYRVPGGLRERIVEESVPPLAADNDWVGVFLRAAAELREGLA